MLTILLYTFIGITAIQFFYFIFIFGKFAFGKEEAVSKKNSSKSVSVIICAKNQAKNLATLVPILMDQDHSDYEIILINDASIDNTMDFLEAFEKQYKNIRIVNVENNEAFWANKKYSLTLGIKVAKKDYLLFIEPDCYPISRNWIRLMSNSFTEKKTIVLGYSGYEKVKKSFLNKIIRLDSILETIQYFSWTEAEYPYTGIGKNLAYNKKDFFEASGFINHMKIKSGEDELFINQIATNENTAICYSPESFTYSKAKSNYKDWYQKKVKSYITSRYFKTRDKLKIDLFQTSQLLFFVLALALLLFQFNWIIILLLVLARYSIVFITLNYSAKRLNEKELLYWYPFIEIVIIYTQFNIFIIDKFNVTIKAVTRFSKSLYWKLKIK